MKLSTDEEAVIRTSVQQYWPDIGSQYGITIRNEQIDRIIERIKATNVHQTYR